MRWRWRTRLGVVGVLAGTAMVAGALPSNADPRPYGDARILAPVPDPSGFPEGIAVRDGRVYVAGPATFGTTGKPASRVSVFDRVTGAQVEVHETKGEDLLAEHANSSIAFDGSGRLYVLNTQLGLYRLVLPSGEQQPYGRPFPDLKPCPLADPCSPTPTDMPSIPNDLAFDDTGNAYVTDSTQATIWKVPAGGGDPQVWFQDARLASPYIGTNGIRINPARTHLFITVTTDLLGQASAYRLPVGSPPKPGQLKLFHRFAPNEWPDGIAFGQDGDLYVALALPGTSGIKIIRPDGTRRRTLRNPPASPFAPYDSPANLAFDGQGAVLATNHAFLTGVVLPSQFSVVDVWVDDAGSPLVAPALP